MVPSSLYIRCSGFSVTPREISIVLMTPLSCSSVIHAKVRTTMPVSIGAITAISSRAWPMRERARAIRCARG